MAVHNWHSLSVEDSLRFLSSDSRSGLSAVESEKRVEAYGRNELIEVKGVTAFGLLLSQLKNVLVIILILAVCMSALLGHTVEAAVIGAIVLFAVLLGFAQEYRAEKVMDALREMSAPSATVLRGGEERRIPAKNIVPGDVVLLSAGDRVPADARVIEPVNLQTDESALTGESQPVEKHAHKLEEKAGIGDRKNMVFSGTTVTYGRGRAVVTATGMHTEFGKIAGMLQAVKPEQTPLQKNLDKVGHALAKISLVIVLLISALGYMRGQPLLEIVLFGIALAVAVVPEALPAVVTVSLAISVQRMVKRHALVRRQPVVETLGSTTVICSDKTGTLTRNEMTVREIHIASGFTFEVTGSGYDPQGHFTQGGKVTRPPEALLELLRGGVLCSDADVVSDGQGGYEVRGDPTEGGVVVAAMKAGMQKNKLNEQHPRIAEIPFTSESKRMTTIHEDGSDETMVYAKGAPEVILNACDRLWGESGEVPMTASDRERLKTTAEAMAARALRVIAVARKGDAGIEESQTDMKFLGFIGMIDPPRSEAKAAIALCKQAGIRVMMITGDHPVTARAIAKELGLLGHHKVVTGADVDEMDEPTFEKEIEKIAVFARVSPAHKLRVVSALQRKGEIVAMTGDGVNDAPALKKADIGIAMGITGTDVTKEAAAMTLTDDNFASIVAAVEEGRAVYGNIKKYLMYLLSANFGEVLIMTGAALLGWPLPLTAAQILYVNLATDGLPALALAADPPEKDLMKRPPRNPRLSIFTRDVLALLATRAVCMAVANLCVFGWALRSGRPFAEATTVAFMTLIVIELAMAYALRSERHSILNKPFNNKWLNLSVLVQLPVFLAILYVTPFGKLFHVTVPTAADWTVTAIAALSVISVLEAAKFALRSMPPRKTA